MSVRAKFQVQSIKELAWSKTHREITLAPQYDTSIPEDRRYATATPSGSIMLMVDNPAASDQLKLGEFFYVDFTPCESEAVAATA
jgi:hypothetical protein